MQLTRSDFAKIALLRDLPEGELDNVDVQVTHRVFSEGQTVFDQNDNSKDVYFLETGRLVALLWTENGKELIFNNIFPNAYLGELSALDNGTRSLAVYAQQDSEVLVMKQASFLKLFEQCKTVRERIVIGLVQRVRDLTERNIEMSTYSVEMRVRSFLVRLALKQNQFIPNGVVAGVPTHAEISNTIGANREAVSRTFSALVRNDILSASRKEIIIHSPDQLIDGL